MATSQPISTLELAHSVQGDYAPDFQVASLAARLADSFVSPDFLPDLWQTYYQRFHAVLSAELIMGAE